MNVSRSLGIALALAGLLSQTACTLPQAPVPEVVPTVPPELTAEVAALRQDVTTMQQQIGALDGRVSSLEPWTARIAVLEALGIPPSVPKNLKALKPGRDLLPVELIARLQRQARIEPTERCFFGTAECTYTFQTGKVYPIYLTSQHSSSLSLPPGERARESLVLDPDEFSVKQLLGGSEQTAYSVLTLRPKVDKADISVVLLTESGRRYLLQLIVGKAGFQSVAFELPQLPIETPAPKLVLPRPVDDAR